MAGRCQGGRKGKEKGEGGGEGRGGESMLAEVLGAADSRRIIFRLSLRPSSLNSRFSKPTSITWWPGEVKYSTVRWSLGVDGTGVWRGSREMLLLLPVAFSLLVSQQPNRQGRVLLLVLASHYLLRLQAKHETQSLVELEGNKKVVFNYHTVTYEVLSS